MAKVKVDKQIKIEPKHFDKIIDALVDILEQLEWLDVAFGKSQTLIKNGKRYPGIYVNLHQNKGEYVNLLPNDRFGNFSFLHFPSVYQNSWSGLALATIKTDFELIIWFDYSNIFQSDHEQRTIYNVKELIYDHLSRKRIKIPGAFIEWDEDVEDFDTIYSGWDINQENEQFLMRPYGALKLTGSMTFLRGICNA